MGLVAEQDIFMGHLALLVTEARRLGFQVTGGELWRSPEQQKIYFDTGRSKTLTASRHLSRLAIDLNFFKDGKLLGTKASMQSLGDFWESLDSRNKWGGNWKTLVDCPHFERCV